MSLPARCSPVCGSLHQVRNPSIINDFTCDGLRDLSTHTNDEIDFENTTERERLTDGRLGEQGLGPRAARGDSSPQLGGVEPRGRGRDLGGSTNVTLDPHHVRRSHEGPRGHHDLKLDAHQTLLDVLPSQIDELPSTHRGDRYRLIAR